MRKADNLPPYCAVVKNSRSRNLLDPSGPAWPVTGVLLLLLYHSLMSSVCAVRDPAVQLREGIINAI